MYDFYSSAERAEIDQILIILKAGRNRERAQRCAQLQVMVFQRLFLAAGETFTDEFCDESDGVFLAVKSSTCACNGSLLRHRGAGNAFRDGIKKPDSQQL